MKQKTITPMLALKQLINECGSQRAAALRLKITPQYLSDILRERRGISENVASELGFNRKTVYEAEK
jgi:plasmid maintenance system antidote protein VapI